jgi:hypothetical protein
MSLSLIYIHKKNIKLVNENILQFYINDFLKNNLYDIKEINKSIKICLFIINYILFRDIRVKFIILYKII